jgi:hypothetical protein
VSGVDDVLGIVREHLLYNGYAGLYSEDCCCCEVSDLAPCGEMRQDCRPGHKIPCPGPENCTADGNCAWHIGEKP